MSYLALYRKYRPTNFSDLVGQNEISDTIKNEILNNRISHAYLFSGPRGTGKTSTAKIIAKMINCSDLSSDGVPCGKCPSCLNFDSSSDVVEIDAASNNGVDEIRDLRDKVNLVPSYGRYKVYIIDEVHMLTTQAFNALLKTLEEPPAHIVFILATTEFYKIPVTVVSRCQKFQFLKFSNDDIVNRLRNICNNESFSVNDDVLFEIARLSDGGMRDAINMLDQLSSFKANDLSVDDVYKLNGVVSYIDFVDLLKKMKVNEIKYVVEFVENLDKNGKNFGRFIDDFINFVKDVLIYKSTGYFSSYFSDKVSYLSDISDLFDVDILYKFIFSFNDLAVIIKNSSFPKILLITEFINLSKVCSNVVMESNALNSTDDNTNIEKNKDIVNNKKTNINMEKSNKNNLLFTRISDKEKMIRINNTFATASKRNKETFVNNWSFVVEKASNDSNFVAITGMINDIEAMVVGNGYVIFVAQYDSLLDRLFNHINIIEKLLFEVYQNNYKVVFLLEDEWNYEKEKYINSLKNGMKYELIDDLESNNNVLDDSDKKNVDNDVEKIVSILGNDIISYE